MIRTSCCCVLVLLLVTILLTPLAIGQKKAGEPVKYPIVHVRKWQVNYTLTASEKFSVKPGPKGEAFHQPSWSINGSAILEAIDTDGSPRRVPADATGNVWEGSTDSSGSFMGQCWMEPSAGFRQTYVGAGSAARGSRSGNNMTFRVDAQQGTYEISLTLELDGRLLLDTSEAAKKLEEVRSKSNSSDVLSEALFEFLRSLVKSAPEGERFKQQFDPESLRQPLPNSGQAATVSGSRKVSQYVQGLVVSAVKADFSWTITPYDGSKDADVTLAGCTELGVGQQGTVTAKGQPSGGSYRYWVDPSSALAVEGQGSTAKISGTAPGQATLHVEYSAPDGKKGQTSQPATCLRLDAINDGQPIPKIGLFDESGKKTEATRSVSVSVQPEGAGDLLVYKTANPGMLTVVGQGTEVLLQGLRKGKTTFQASTKCGGPTGPVAEVEVVACDDEVLAKLAEEEKIVDENLKQAYEEDAHIRESEEFEEAEKIGDATGELLLKTGSMIIGPLSGGASHSVHTAAQIWEYGNIIHDGMKGGDSAATAGLMATVTAAKMAVAGAIITGVETLKAATEFGKSLGALEGTADQLEANNKWIDHWRQMKEDVVRRQRICRTGGEPAPPPPTEPPTKKQPPKKDPQPPKDQPPAKTEPPTSEPPSEPPGEEPPSPPPPTSAPRHFGLPYDEGECGCKSSTGKGQATGLGKVGPTGKSTGSSQTGKSGTGPGLGAKSGGIAETSQGLKNLGRCVQEYQDGPLAEYQKTLDEWDAVLTELQTAASAPEADRTAAMKGAIGRVDSLLGRTQEFDKAGHAFYTGFQPCPGEVKGAAGQLTAKPAAK